MGALGTLTLGACEALPGPETEIRWDLRERTAAWGLAFEAPPGSDGGFSGGGAAVGDFNGDGLPDLVVTSYYGSEPAVYLNQGGRFARVEDAHHGLCSGASSVTAADIDGDGASDLIVGRSDGVAVLRSLRDGHFELMDWLVQHPTGAQLQSGVAVADYDGDLRLDVYVCVLRGQNASGPAASGDHLFRGRGDFSFEDTTASLGPAARHGNCFNASWADIDRDGLLDVVAVDDAGGADGVTYDLRNRVFLQRREAGSRSFVESAASLGLDAQMGSMGSTMGDLDGDGSPELVVSDIGPDVRIFGIEDGGVDLTAAWGADYGPHEVGLNGWGVELADLNNDGRPELLASFGGRQYSAASAERRFGNRLWTWNGVDGLEDLSERVAGCGTGSHWRNPLVGDFDVDGSLDVLFTSYVGGLCLLEGSTAGHHALQIALDGPPGNREGHGARVEVTTADGHVQEQWITAGSTGVHSSRESVAHFGLGQFDVVERLVVTWPHGTVVELQNVDADRRLVIDSY